MKKRSRQRELLLEVLRNTTCHPDADWIFQRMREKMPNISLGTVYRNLAKLSADGTILKLQVGQNAERFDGCTDHHYHLACNVCGHVLDLSVPYASALDAAASESGCLVEKHTLLFHGKCPSCMGNNK
ncbi:MAG: transcriptional repressor [Clostridia bacterium]|nr:transcriptional repressor [Clostridia bacterium]